MDSVTDDTMKAKKTGTTTVALVIALLVLGGCALVGGSWFFLPSIDSSVSNGVVKEQGLDSLTSPETVPIATGFPRIRPVSWAFSGGEPDSSELVFVIENVAGQNLMLWLNDSDKGSIKFKKPGSADCYLSDIIIIDSSGKKVNVKNNAISIPFVKVYTLYGKLVGKPGDKCGGAVGERYEYSLTMLMEDESKILHRDIGTLNANYVKRSDFPIELPN